MRSGTAIVLVADLSSAGPAGYLVAHVCEGPDDTFAVADRYAELYSLSVAPTHRGRGIGTALLDALDQRLDALGIHDLTVAVMSGTTTRCVCTGRAASRPPRSHCGAQAGLASRR